MYNHQNQSIQSLLILWILLSTAPNCHSINSHWLTVLSILHVIRNLFNRGYIMVSWKPPFLFAIRILRGALNYLFSEARHHRRQQPRKDFADWKFILVCLVLRTFIPVRSSSHFAKAHLWLSRLRRDSPSSCGCFSLVLRPLYISLWLVCRCSYAEPLTLFFYLSAAPCFLLLAQLIQFITCLSY